MHMMDRAPAGVGAGGAASGAAGDGMGGSTAAARGGLSDREQSTLGVDARRPVAGSTGRTGRTGGTGSEPKYEQHIEAGVGQVPIKPAQLPDSIPAWGKPNTTGPASELGAAVVTGGKAQRMEPVLEMVESPNSNGGAVDCAGDTASGNTASGSAAGGGGGGAAGRSKKRTSRV